MSLFSAAAIVEYLESGRRRPLLRTVARLSKAGALSILRRVEIDLRPLVHACLARYTHPSEERKVNALDLPCVVTTIGKRGPIDR